MVKIQKGQRVSVVAQTQIVKYPVDGLKLLLPMGVVVDDVCVDARSVRRNKFAKGVLDGRKD